MDQIKQPTQDERIMAALAHGSILLPMWGIILSAVIWVTQKEKSNFVRQQATQAMGWHAGLLGLGAISMAGYFASFFLTFATFATSSGAEPPTLFFLPFACMGLMFIVGFAFIITGIVAAVRTLQGRPFLYPIIGRRINRYLS